MILPPAGSDDRRPLRLVARIGEGAHGEVWLAEATTGAGFTRKVAVKVLGRHHAADDEAARRMRDEARLLGRLVHRHVVAVHDLVTLPDGRSAIVMDLVPGGDLSELLEEAGPLPIPAALEVGAAILRALDFAWHADDGAGGRLGVVHRDIKPANVRVTPDGDVKVLDFGVARFAPALREARTVQDQWLGTERYMAPERLAFEGDTPAGDVYAVGATLIELLRGKPLGRSPVLAERHGPFVEHAIASLRGRVRGPAAEELEDALRAALDADPERRPTAGALAERLEDLARRFDGDPLARFARRIVPAVDRIPASIAPEPPSPTPGRRTWPWVLAAALAVALATTGLTVLAGGLATLGMTLLP